MNRTMICRFDVAVVGAACVAATLAAAAAAQQPPARAAGATQGREGAVVRSAAPASHVVQQGETLWSLAQQYLGDPLLWPEIYRRNTAVVEDPHWIYPGEELQIAGGDTSIVVQSVTVSPSGDTVRQAAPVTPLTGPTIFTPRVSARAARAAVEVRAASAYRAVREGEYYSAGFLTEGQPLSSGRIVSNTETSLLGNIGTRRSTAFYSDVMVDQPPGDSLVPGDLLLAFERGGEVQGYGEIIRPTGLLRVEGVEGNRYRARLTRQYGEVGGGQELIKVSPFTFTTSRHATPVSDSLEAPVIALRDPHEMAVPLSVLFLGRGADEGVQLGDVFRIYRPAQGGGGYGAVDQDQARALVVSTRSRSSTAIIVELFRGDIRPGVSSARLVRRMPS